MTSKSDDKFPMTGKGDLYIIFHSRKIHRRRRTIFNRTLIGKLNYDPMTSGKPPLSASKVHMKHFVYWIIIPVRTEILDIRVFRKVIPIGPESGIMLYSGAQYVVMSSADVCDKSVTNGML